ncbi:hypothetical protein AA313_de0208581 [Arthrobotrys entomopaga]|nr:hypothetical protein AA313_de0208581 [Arthrobotrys entomopaga]
MLFNILMIAVSLVAAETAVVAQQEVFMGGWAVRSQGCASGQQDCGPSTLGFHVCCPQGQFCRNPVGIQGFEQNTGCCPTVDSADCSQDLARFYICASDAWGLYNNSGYPFCCQSGDKGGTDANKTYDSCRSIAASFPSGEVALPQDAPDSRTKTLFVTTTFAPTPGPTGTSAGQAASDSTPMNCSNLAPGAIAGIIVGSIVAAVALALGMWCLGRRSGRSYSREKEELLRQVGGINSNPVV